MSKNRHVFLINEKATNPKFNRSRNVQSTDDKKEEDSKLPKIINETQKVILRKDRDNLNVQKTQRKENRTIIFPEVIDLIRINFYCIFNQDLEAKFNSRYGLSVIEYSSFNKTVMFEVYDQNLFQTFLKHIKTVITSPENTSYENQPFNLIALIYHFEFISSQTRITAAHEGTLLFTLISSAKTISRIQNERLFSFLQEQNLKITFNQFSPDIIEVENLNNQQIQFIADNFDIVKAVLSTRVLNIRPGMYGLVRREFGFTVDVPENLTTVCIIDSGVKKIEPLNNTFTNISYDHTGTTAY